MADYLSVVNEAGDQALSLMKRGHEAALSAVSTVSDAAESIVPDLQSRLPLVDRIPAPKDVVATSFDIAAKFFEAQRDYTLALFEAAAPVTDKLMPKGKRTKSTKSTAKATNGKRVA
jgi:hypothetical protein